MNIEVILGKCLPCMSDPHQAGQQNAQINKKDLSHEIDADQALMKQIVQREDINFLHANCIEKKENFKNFSFKSIEFKQVNKKKYKLAIVAALYNIPFKGLKIQDKQTNFVTLSNRNFLFLENNTFDG